MAQYEQPIILSLEVMILAACCVRDAGPGLTHDRSVGALEIEEVGGQALDQVLVRVAVLAVGEPAEVAERRCSRVVAEEPKRPPR